MSDVTPRFTADEARMLLFAAKVVKAQGIDDPWLDGAISALLLGQSETGPCMMIRIGSIPPWMQPVDNMACSCGEEDNGAIQDCDNCDVQHYRLPPDAES